MNGGQSIAVYLDEDVDVLIARLIAARGFQTTTAREVGLLTKSDADHIAYAASMDMALLTHNGRDFEELHRQFLVDDRPHAGIIIARRRDPYRIAERLLILLNQTDKDEMRSQLRYI